MKVLILTPTLGMGGAGLVMVRLASYLGDRIKFVAVCPSQSYPDESVPFRGRIIKVAGLQLNGQRAGVLGQVLRFLRRCSVLATAIRQERPSVVISTLCHSQHRAAGILRLCGLLRCPLVIRFGVPPAVIGEPPGGALLTRLVVQRADCVLANSVGLAKEVAETYGIPVRRIQVIHNPVDTALVERLANQLVPELASLTGRRVIVTVGRLSAQKDHATLIRAFAKVRRQLDATLVLVGSGELEEQLTQLAYTLGVGADVRITGWRHNPFPFLRRADVFVLSSRYEGFPSTLVEAMACGSPVVSTNCPHGPAEILENGRVGRLVPVGDEETMATEIVSLLQNDSLRERFRAAGRARAKDFDLPRVAAEYERLFEGLTRRQQATC